MTYFIYFIAAALAGLIAGTLGGGIGMVLVPVMIWIFKSQHIPSNIIMHLTIGTNVAAIAVMGTVASIGHHRKHAVNWLIVKRSVVLLFIGIVIGSLFAAHLPSHILMLAFGVVVLLLAAYTALAKDRVNVNTKLTTLPILSGFGLVVGFVGSTLGINPFCVPFFKKVGLEIHNAVGTAVVIGTLMAYAVVIMFIITGWNTPGLPRFSTGFVDWEIFVPFAIASSFFAPLGTKLSHKLPKTTLKYLYACLLIVVGIKMLFNAF